MPVPVKILFAAACLDEGRSWVQAAGASGGAVRILGLVSSGSALMEMAAHTVPDLIITDAVLPDIDGPAMIRNLRHQGRHCRFIIVGLPDIGQACAALLCKADDFLPRPVLPQALCASIARIHAEIEAAAFSPAGLDYRSVIGQLFFERARSVSEQNQLPEELVNSMYGTRFQAGAYRAVFLYMGRQLEPADLSKMSELFEKFSTLLLTGVTPYCRDLFCNLDFFCVQLLLNYSKEDDAAIVDALEACLDSIPPAEADSIPIVICCSSLYTHIHEIRRMLDEVSDIVWTRFTAQNSGVLFTVEEPPCPPEVLRIYEQTDQQLKSACATLDLQTFQQRLDAFFALPDQIVGRRETRSMIRSVEYNMFEVNRDLISEFTNATVAKRDMMLDLRIATSLAEYKRRYRTHLIDLFQQILSVSSSQLSRPIRLAQWYIQERYAEPIRLEEVAGHVGLSPVYLSARFKQETGVGFSEYVNQCRIQKAQDYLENREMTIAEISKETGFSNPRYFSRIFKKQLGVKPSEYRSSKRKNIY